MQWQRHRVQITGQVDRIKQRLFAQSQEIERVVGDDLKEEKAILRNILMQLEGVKLLLKRRKK